MSIRRRLAIGAALAVALAVAAASLASYVAVRAQLRGDVDDSLRQQVERVQREGARALPPPGICTVWPSSTLAMSSTFSPSTTTMPRDTSTVWVPAVAVNVQNRRVSQVMGYPRGLWATTKVVLPLRHSTKSTRP